MLKMTTLEKIEPLGQTQRSWGVRHGLVLLGAVILLPSFASTAIIWKTWPVYPSPEEVRRQYQAMTPRESWQRWQRLRQNGPDPRVRQFEEAYGSAVRRHQLWLIGAVACVAGGVALIAVPLLQARRSAADADAPQEGQGDG